MIDRGFLTELGIDEETGSLIMEKYEREKLDESIASELDAAGSIDAEAALAMLDKEGLTSENLKDRVVALKESHPALFKTKQPRIISNAENKFSINKEGFSKMSYRERLELFKKNPDTYKRLVD